jgi:protein subunit release factor B
VKKKLFTVTKEDCDWQSMTAGGPGGQHQNRSQTAIRCTHRASGAVGVSRSHRSQLQNKQEAFRRMAESQRFQTWAKLRAAEALGAKSLDEVVTEIVDEQMQERYLKIETAEHR